MFFPLVNVEKLSLPKERCAGYMRMDELSTISAAHKAIMVHDNIQHDKPLPLNMDGLTLNQKKLGGAAINNMVNVLPQIELLKLQFKMYLKNWRS